MPLLKNAKYVLKNIQKAVKMAMKIAKSVPCVTIIIQFYIKMLRI